MAKVFPVRLKGIWGVFDGVARVRLCENSGSEHSAAESLSADLSELVDSFLERERDERVEEVERMEKKTLEEERGGSEWKSNSETKEILMGLISGGGAGDGDGCVQQRIRTETEIAWRSVGSGSSEGFKRRVMSLLRQRGLDAGLCKSRWEKTSLHPAGEYEYIDIINGSATGDRYIVELSTISEFTIARPTNHYESLLEAIPRVLVCKEEELKRVVRLMCAAMRESLTQRDMHVPPWRRNGYMMAKWFGSYKRTPATTILGNGFSPVLHRRCKGEVMKQPGLHVGKLSATISGMHL
ncbi:uncharacterized protein LOC132310494 [Cornus florida]|uniref:uncharacterized protein LOC132310494 n=1 Tax=Cornus florida TaxID=4283 RepID=UPI00289FEA81|nr:uncharacterized protein LOC132310494 [Cornus florida]